jgi:tetratricopeptide (TPR) repeat protein
MNKKILWGVIFLVILGAGIVWFTKTHKPIPTAQQEQFSGKIADLMKIVNDPKSSKADVMGAWLQIGINYESLGQLDQEEAAFLKAAEVDPNSYLPWSNLGTLYIEMHRYDKAAEALQKALSINNTDPNLWLKWINFNRYQVGTDDKHIRMIFNDAYKATNNNNLLLRAGASYLEDIGDLPGALSAWQAVLKQSPNDAAVKAEITKLQAAIKAKK